MGPSSCERRIAHRTRVLAGGCVQLPAGRARRVTTTSHRPVPTQSTAARNSTSCHSEQQPWSRATLGDEHSGRAALHAYRPPPAYTTAVHRRHTSTPLNPSNSTATPHSGHEPPPNSSPPPSPPPSAAPAATPPNTRHSTGAHTATATGPPARSVVHKQHRTPPSGHSGSSEWDTGEVGEGLVSPERSRRRGQ